MTTCGGSNSDDKVGMVATLGFRVATPPLTVTYELIILSMDLCENN